MKFGGNRTNIANWRGKPCGLSTAAAATRCSIRALENAPASAGAVPIVPMSVLAAIVQIPAAVATRVPLAAAIGRQRVVVIDPLLAAADGQPETGLAISAPAAPPLLKAPAAVPALAAAEEAGLARGGGGGGGLRAAVAAVVAAALHVVVVEAAADAAVVVAVDVAPICGSSTTSYRSAASTMASVSIASPTTAATEPLSG